MEPYTTVITELMDTYTKKYDKCDKDKKRNYANVLPQMEICATTEIDVSNYQNDKPSACSNIPIPVRNIEIQLYGGRTFRTAKNPLRFYLTSSKIDANFEVSGPNGSVSIVQKKIVVYEALRIVHENEDKTFTVCVPMRMSQPVDDPVIKFYTFDR